MRAGATGRSVCARNTRLRGGHAFSDRRPSDSSSVSDAPASSLRRRCRSPSSFSDSFETKDTGILCGVQSCDDEPATSVTLWLSGDGANAPNDGVEASNA